MPTLNYLPRLQPLRQLLLLGAIASLLVGARPLRSGGAKMGGTKRAHPAVLFRTDDSEIQWLVLDVPALDGKFFGPGTTLRLFTSGGSVRDTLFDEVLVTHFPQRARPTFSHQLYFVRNTYPHLVEAALDRGGVIAVELYASGAALSRRYSQADHTLLVNRHLISLNRGLHISSSSVHSDE